MNLNFGYFNFGAIVLCHVIYMGLGALWYSSYLFGNQWAKAIDLKMDEMDKKEAQKAMLLGNIPTFLQVLVVAQILNLVNAQSILDALVMGSILSMGIIGINLIQASFFEKKSPLYLAITIGYHTVAFLIISSVLTLWK